MTLPRTIVRFIRALATSPRRRGLVPAWVSFFDPVAKLLLGAGVPMGPDVLLTVRGRKSGLPRSTPVAVAEIAGRAILTTRGIRADVTAVELDAVVLAFNERELGHSRDRHATSGAQVGPIMRREVPADGC